MRASFNPVSNFIKQLTRKSTTEKVRSKAFLLALSRTTSADTNIRDIEVQKVQELLKEHSGKDYSTSDIRVAAKSYRYEKEPLDRFIARASKRLSQEDKIDIAFGMMAIMKSDGRVGSMERKYYDRMVGSLKLTPSQLMEHAA